MKFRDKLIRFMYGRYGVDSLYKGLLALYVILLVINIFVHSKILTAVMSAVIFYTIFRMLSKNHIARAKENRAYLKLITPPKRFFKNLPMRIKDIGKKRYRTCPHCKATVRLPIKRGKHQTRCPKCQKSFTVRIIL